MRWKSDLAKMRQVKIIRIPRGFVRVTLEHVLLGHIPRIIFIEAVENHVKMSIQLP